MGKVNWIFKNKHILLHCACTKIVLFIFFPEQITPPTGTQVVVSHGQVYHFYGLNTINIFPSTLDMDVTRGLCGIFNGDQSDEFTVRNELGTADIETFVKSWK